MRPILLNRDFRVMFRDRDRDRVIRSIDAQWDGSRAGRRGAGGSSG
jgi:hypothetical protein